MTIDELIEEHVRATREYEDARVAGQWIAQVLLASRVVALERRILDLVEESEGWT